MSSVAVFLRRNILLVLALPAVGAAGVGVYAKLVRTRTERRAVQELKDSELTVDEKTER